MQTFHTWRHAGAPLKAALEVQFLKAIEQSITLLLLGSKEVSMKGLDGFLKDSILGPQASGNCCDVLLNLAPAWNPTDGHAKGALLYTPFLVSLSREWSGPKTLSSILRQSNSFHTGLLCRIWMTSCQVIEYLELF